MTFTHDHDPSALERAQETIALMQGTIDALETTVAIKTNEITHLESCLASWAQLCDRLIEENARLRQCLSLPEAEQTFHSQLRNQPQ